MGTPIGIIDVEATGLENDADVRAALEWLAEIAPNNDSLNARIEAAQQYYREHSQPRDNRDWRETSSLVIKNDLIASYLAQGHALLNKWRAYDVNLSARVVPFIKDLGKGIEYLRDIPNAGERARRMLNPRNEHPDGALYELVTAVRYAHEQFEIEFATEGAARGGDLLLGAGGMPKEIQIECKRLRPSVYELREAVVIRGLLEPLQGLIHSKRLTVHVDVEFSVPVADVPQGYLAEWVDKAVGSRLILAEGYPWKDQFATGVIRRAGIDAVSEDMRETYLLFGPKLARLLAGRYLVEGTYHMVVSAKPAAHDPRYLDEIDYASILTWHCLAPESIESRARHIGSKLADVDRQLANAKIGILHIGMDAERDPMTADLRRDRNTQTVRNFRARSNMAEVHLHYFMPRVSEQSTWMIDESVDSSSMRPEFLLDDRRLLILGSPDIENDLPVWRLPPPPT